MGKRRQAREYCLQALYLKDTCDMSVPRLFSILSHDADSFDEKTLAFAKELIENTLKNFENIDSIIEKRATNWSLKRMTPVDRSILRMATYEIIYTPKTPFAAVIDESIELAKKYSTDNSGSFINGVLEKIWQNRDTCANDK
jgi:transcription antitermination protein NusB